MQFTSAVTLDDYRAGNRIMCLHTLPRRRRDYLFITRATPVLAVVLLAASAYLIFVAHQTRGPIIACLALAAAMIYSPIQYHLKIRRFYSQQKLGHPTDVVVTAEGMKFLRQDGAAETRYSWSIFDGWFESEEYLVLFPSQQAFIPIPKRALTPEQQTELRALFAAHIPQK
jgi:hypothetical protein